MADVYTSGSGNWTSLGNGVVNIKLRGTGGGGAAGEAGGGDRAGSGGGGGAYCEVIALPVTIGQSVAYSIGTPGIGGTYDNDDATAGTATTADGGTYSAGGGGKGGFGGGAAGGAGGTASGGDINTSGAAGSVNPTSTTGGAGGAGANSGGSGGVGGDPGVSLAGDGADPGGGGGGGGDNGSFGGGNTADGGGGGGGSAAFDFTADPLITSEILRPIDGLEEYAANTTWQDIDDTVTQPTVPGSVDYLEYPGTSITSYTEKWLVEPPTTGYIIRKATLWVLARSAQVSPNMYFTSARAKLNGTWYELTSLSPNNLSPVTVLWHQFEVTGISESTDSADIGFELVILSSGAHVDQKAQIDAAYLELTYPESVPSVGGFFAWW